MKPAQWIGAVLAGAAMVFVITFALNYVGTATRTGTEGTEKEALQLNFATTQAPPAEMTALGSEVHKPDWYDFWFRNENDKPVRVGLHTKNCKCTHVEFYLLPSDWKSLVPPAWGPLNGIVLGAGPVLAAGQALAANQVAEKLTPVMLEQLAQGEVPPGGQGWVRLKWSGERPGPQQIKANVWTDNPEGPTVSLECRVMYHAPVQATTTVSAGQLSVRQLEQAGSVPVNIYCWSVTRPSFGLEARSDIVRPGGPEYDPFVVGAPVPLTVEEKAKLEKDQKELPGSVRCGYRIPVTLLATSPNKKTPFELGPFQRWVVLSSPDEGIEPMQVLVHGRVQGDVTVSGDDEVGRIILGNFKRGVGTPWRHVSLESDVPGVELRLDRERLPKYLEVRFPDKPDVSSSGHRTWKLEVRVPPNAARGPFPRQEDPAYRDSAVYVQTAGKTARSIRVPVSGTANDG